MAKWVPAVATIGLLCLMILPAPGVLGLIIGCTCAAAIIISTVLWLLNHVTSRVLGWLPSFKRSPTRKRGRVVHAGSSIARKKAGSARLSAGA